MSRFWWTINKAFCNSVTGNKKSIYPRSLTVYSN